jgi:hypothetical protein
MADWPPVIDADGHVLEYFQLDRPVSAPAGRKAN